MQKENIEKALKDARDEVFKAAWKSISSAQGELRNAQEKAENSWRSGRDSERVRQEAEAEIKQTKETIKPVEDSIQTTRSFIEKRLLEQLKAKTDPAQNLKLLSETNPGTNSASQLAKQ